MKLRSQALLGLSAGSFIFYERVLYSPRPMSPEPEIRLFGITWWGQSFPSTHDPHLPKPRSHTLLNLSDISRDIVKRFSGTGQPFSFLN